MGLDLGMRSTGRFDVVACVEKEEVFCATIRENIRCGNLHEQPRIYQGDIKKLSPIEVTFRTSELTPGEVDVVVGGPPCQSFSTGRQQGSVQDPRGTLLWDFIRF